MPRSDWEADIETRKWITGMNTFAKKDHPRVVAESLNAPAAAIEQQARRNVEKRMIVRTQYTTGSIKQDRHARGENINRMYSRVRTNSPYLKIQDEGGVIKGEGQRTAIPLAASRTGRNIRKSIAKRYKINQLGSLQRNRDYFMGRSPVGNRKLAIFQRLRGNKLRMLRRATTADVRIRGKRWWSDPNKQYGTPQYIRAQYIRLSRVRLRRYMR
jgi:hypothetical protein